jgi:hypothetical protein
MSRPFSFLLWMIGMLLAGHCVPAVSQSVAIYVSDYHDKPISGTILSTKGGGSTSPPTDISGKTRIVVPSSLQPGDELQLSLVRAPVHTMRIVAPWQGGAIVPRSSGFIQVVLGVPGDKWALRDPRVVSSWALAIVQKSEAPSLLPPEQKRKETLVTFAKQAGFTPEQIDSAIRALADVNDPYQRHAVGLYLDEYPTAPKTY